MIISQRGKSLRLQNLTAKTKISQKVNIYANQYRGSGSFLRARGNFGGTSTEGYKMFRPLKMFAFVIIIMFVAFLKWGEIIKVG